MIALGIDPGKEGAIAVLDPDGKVLELIPIPMIEGKRPEYDVVACRGVLFRWRRLGGHAGGLHVVVEKQQPMPLAKGGTIANYNRGMAAGWAWMLCALEIPHTLVAPQTWQKRMHEGTSGNDTKQKSIVAVQRLFPGVDLKRTSKARTPDEGKADALLLAEYGRRTFSPAPLLQAGA